ncbi:hypothetical protein KIW84_062305 [Lathyrus oleraceus]|uniref:FMR1-interacting protein 1 conserved domain-containing protein n=1 Tax=Pisum sativum TaxID=3888 RepID=A0A9D4W5H5_PEA|nr:hypothetical protein KIW84_062305 [Pisum sativum]
MQNMNQQLPMQMQRPYGMHPVQQQPMFGFPPNQLPPHPMVPQNPTFSGNSQFGVVPGNQVRPPIAPNPAAGNPNGFVSGPFPSQQLQGNTSVPHNTNNAQSSAFRNSHSQESRVFKKITNACEKKTGPNNERAGTFGLNSEEHQQQPQRSYSATYSEQEILRWRDARRKNHPSREKNEKTQSEQSKDSKCIDREVLQRELKEVLAKQAELGVEVAEIPSYYLKNAANQGLQSEENETPFTNKRKFKNKARRNPNKRRRNGKKQKLADKDFLENKKKPTLLQKLLSANIVRDQSYLFQKWGLKFMMEKKHLHGGKDVVEDGTKGITK